MLYEGGFGRSRTTLTPPGHIHPEIEWSPFEESHTPSYGVEGALRIRN